MKILRTLSAALMASMLALAPASADLYLWSQTPNNNSNADLADDINLVEGMAPSEVNDSIRAVMAELAKWRDDLGGVKPSAVLMSTSGTANAQTLSTNGTAAALTHGHTVCFIVGPGLTNTGATTLNVDSFGAKAVQGRNGTAMAGGELAASALNCATYQSGDQVWLLHQYRPIDAASITYSSIGALQRAALTGDVTATAGSNTTAIAAGAIVTADIGNSQVTAAKMAFPIPVGWVFDTWATACPSGSVAAYGQTLTGEAATAINAVAGTTAAPDMRGRVVVGEDDAGGATSSANRVTVDFNGDVRGATGGAETHALTEAELASHDHTDNFTLPSHAHSDTFANSSHTHGDTFALTGTLTDIARNRTMGSKDDGTQNNFDFVFKPKGWAGPHLFIFNDEPCIGLGCPLQLTGIGSPGFNATAWHLECVAAFDPGVDDDDAGKGFVIKDTACFCIAVLMRKQGWDADDLWRIKFHKEDPRTTHKTCPGSDLEKPDVIARVRAYLDNLEEVGEHEPQQETFKRPRRAAS